MIFNPFAPLAFIKITSLKATVILLLILLTKSNLLRVKGGIIGALLALGLISGILVTSSLAIGSLVYAFNIRNKYKNFNNDDANENLQAIEI